MITPSKYIPFDQSIMNKMLVLLRSREDGISVSDYYNTYKHHFDGVYEFMLSLDVLYVLNKIDVDFDTGELKYVD